MNDLKFAFRQLLKNPGFAAVAVLTLALGIGATAAVCSLIQGVLLTPSLYRKPEQLILITPESLDRRRHGRGLYGKQWLEWQKKAKSFEAVAGYAWGFCFLLLPGGSESLQGLAVTSDYFHVLGIQPALGRTFVDADGDPFAYESSPSVIILGHTLWQRIFNGDPSVIGRNIQLRRNASPPVTFTARVVGVMPPGIRFPPAPNEDDPNYNVDAQVDYWFPRARGNLRRAFTLGEFAQARDGHPHSRWRSAETHPQPGAQRRISVDSYWAISGDGDFYHPGKCASHVPFRNPANRSAHTGDGDNPLLRCCSDCVFYPRPLRNQSRSDGGAPMRMMKDEV